MENLANPREAVEQPGEGTAPFSTVFDPLAHHFFPDGCPVGDTIQRDESAYLQQVWPVSQRRMTVSSSTVVQSIAVLRKYAVTNGLTAAELVTVAMIATATLPSGPSTVHSPVRDGNTAHFCSLIRCLLPKQCESSADDNKAMSIIADRLLSSFGWSSKGTAPASVGYTDQEAVWKAKCCILRFLTLAALQCGTSHCFSQLHINIIFQAVLQPETTVDAARFLLHRTTTETAMSLPPFRLAQLRSYLEQLSKKKNSVSVAAVQTLLELHGDTLDSGKNADERSCVDFPDEEWEHEFRSERLVLGGEGDTSCRSPSNHRRITKRPRRSRSNLLRLSTFLQNQLRLSSDGRHVDKAKLASTASDLLDDVHRRQLLSLTVEDMSSNESIDAGYFRGVLPFKLHEQWFQQEVDREHLMDVVQDTDNDKDMDIREKSTVQPQSRRLQMLSSLADFAVKTDCLPVEAQVFITEHILATWDGDCDSEIGQILLYNVLPYMHPFSLSHKESFGGRFLEHLERFFLYGSNRLQYALVSGTLSGLIQRWSRMDWLLAMQTKNKEKAIEKKNRAIAELIRWTDDLLLKGFLASDDGDELLRAATVDFYLSVCDVTRTKDHGRSTNAVVHVPSPSLTYRLLLSPSALHIDRVCGLLVRYKDKWKHGQTRSQENCDTNEAIFNCFVWDFCAVLWRCTPFPSPQASSAKTKSTDESARIFSILYTDTREQTQETLFKSAPASALSITHGAVFAGYSSDFLEHFHIHSRDTNQLLESGDQIRGQLKIQYLDYLKSRGLNGIHEFLHIFNASLAPRKDNSE